MKNDSAILKLVALNALFSGHSSREKVIRDAMKESVEPWVIAKIDIPKSMHKGKSYEEILEIKKQIWLSLKDGKDDL